MRRDPTPASTFADFMLNGRLDDIVAQARKEGLSWRRVARLIDTLTEGHVVITDQTLRSWYVKK